MYRAESRSRLSSSEHGFFCVIYLYIIGIYVYNLFLSRFHSPRTDTRDIVPSAVKSYINIHTLLLFSLSKTCNNASLSLLNYCRIF